MDGGDGKLKTEEGDRTAVGEGRDKAVMWLKKRGGEEEEEMEVRQGGEAWGGVRG